MKTYNKNEPLISIHIPKCAGNSFYKIIDHWYGEKLRLHYFNEMENKMPVKYSLDGEEHKGICIHGHFNKTRGFGVQDYYPEAKQFIAMLREPFEVSLSNYFFVKQRHAQQKSYRDGKPYALEEFDSYVKNAQSFILLHMPFEMTLNNYKDIIDEYFVYIGIVEDLQVSVDCLAKKLGFPRVALEHLNKAERDIGAPLEHLRKAFVERHPVEYAMYEYAIAKYKQ